MSPKAVLTAQVTTFAISETSILTRCSIENQLSIGGRAIDLTRPELPKDLEVYIDSLDEQGRVTYISGYFELRDTRLKFDAIGMEGYGGPNIAATLSEETLGALRQIGLNHEDIDELITALQRKIMEGEAHIELRRNLEPSEDKTEYKKQSG
ncbi:hypothetical protein A3K71_01840 [archaeon RBG_16_50_20]|nr:MAG: hypothetical protein A3K71_01840 [archaeon RBG_16_50_20]